MSKQIELKEIVMTLVGPIDPCGEHDADVRRMGNLEDLIELTDCLLSEIVYASRSANRQEASMKAIGSRAERFLNGLRESLDEDHQEAKAETQS